MKQVLFGILLSLCCFDSTNKCLKYDAGLFYISLRVLSIKLCMMIVVLVRLENVTLFKGSSKKNSKKF